MALFQRAVRCGAILKPCNSNRRGLDQFKPALKGLFEFKGANNDSENLILEVESTLGLTINKRDWFSLPDAATTVAEVFMCRPQW